MTELRSAPPRCAEADLRVRLLAVVALAVLVLAAGCIRGGRPYNPLRPEIDPKDEREIGYAFDQEIGQHLVFIDDPVVLGFMNDLGRSIVSELGEQPFVYHFRVIRDPALNAFAVPGGFIYFHSGTIRAAGSLDELAGVMAHEIGHVKGRHFARMSEETALPSMLTTIAGAAAAVATKEPVVAIAAQAANVAMQLRFSREYEAEADRLAVTFMRRAGYEPDGLVRFFERIVVERDRDPVNIPPYLYSHPEVEDRISSVLDLATRTRAQGAHAPDLPVAFRAARERLDLLLHSDRTSLATAPPVNRSKTDPLLTWAERLAAQEDFEGALGVLAQAEQTEPYDPRVSFRRGEILSALGRHEEAAAAWRRTVVLDPSRAMVYYQLGRAYRTLGDAQLAIHYFEQAARRFGEGSDLRRRAEWDVVKLTFPVVTESGLADAVEAVKGGARERFGPADDEVVWWGRVGGRFVPVREKLRVRFTDAAGNLVEEVPVETGGRHLVLARLPLDREHRAAAGRWTVEALLDQQVVDRKFFRIE